ncbi:MAG: nucleoside hydrolase [Clostridia bacterium]|nr:nucleoside hydrolase [Clostridia bacterium]
MKKTLSFLLTFLFLLTIVPHSAFVVSAEGNGGNVLEIVFDSAEEAAKLVSGSGASAVMYGDVNGDSFISVKDTISLKKYLASFVLQIDEEAADIGGDGDVTANDCLLLRRLIVGDLSVLDGRPVTSSGGPAEYDATENAAVLSAQTAGDISATVTSDELSEGFDASDYRFAGIVYKADTASETGAVYASSEVAEKTSYRIYSDGEYHAKLVDMRMNEGWTGHVDSVSYDLIADAAANDSVYVDSFILTDCVEALEAAVAERLRVRCYPELSVADGSAGAVADSDTFSIVFNSNDALSDVTSPNHTNYSFNKYASCLELEVDSGKSDPHVYLDLSDYGLSADEFKYVTYVYKTRGSSGYERKGEIFFCAGTVARPTGGCSYQFNLSQDGKFYAVTVNASQLKNSSNALYWNGAIHGLRFDYFQDAQPGESVFVKGVVFSKTQSAASAAAALMTGEASLGAMDAKASVDYMYKVYSKDTSGTAFIENADGDMVFNFTGGTVGRFTKTHLGERLSKFISQNVGTTPEVEVLDGYEDLYESYAATERSEGYVTYKVKVDDAFCILFRKTVYNMRKVILDHDLGPDCDDAAAVCIVVKAHMKGEINCLAITSCMYTSMSAYAAQAVPDYLGCYDIPFSYNNERSATGTNVRCCGTPATRYWNNHGPWPTIYHNTSLLRQILAANGEKGDIIFITTGPLTTLYCLFNSQGDSVSPMTGRQLFAANVGSYVVGGGNFSNLNDNEHNFAEDFEATNATVNTITEVPMTFVGANVAGNFLTGDNLPNAPDDWVLKPYYYLQTWEQYYTRQAWDLATVYYAIYGGAGMWQVKSGYSIRSWSNGATIMSSPGPSSYIDPIVSTSYVKAVFNQTMEPYLN